MKKYQASNQNPAPAAVRVENWASVVEIMVAVGLFAAALAYIVAPAMMGAYVFQVFTSGAPLPEGGKDVVVTLSKADAVTLVWLCAFFVKLSGYAVVYFVIYALFTLSGWKNLRFLVNSVMLTALASGDMLRSVGSSVKLPEGSEAPILALSGWFDMTAIATTGFIEGLRYSALAPFVLVGVAGIVMAAYRLSRAQLDKKLAGYRARK